MEKSGAEHKKGQEQILANTSWALAKLLVKDATLLNGIAATSLMKISHFKPQHLANASQMFVTVGLVGAALLRKLSRAGVVVASTFLPVDLANAA